ncbi:MAG: response regulator transcription factor [Candidatus Accumulibacter sp.]|jgi:DNA-binding NarL/FixJ family response regulator|nr:response regulator transcription factor [Accumulibacter sp.]
MTATRVIIVDDHRLVRAGIASLLEGVPGIAVAGEAADGAQALELIAKCNPDVVLLDLAMPNGSGFDVLEHVQKSGRRLKIIVLSMHDSPEHVRRALKLGAAGYLLKDTLPDELVLAIETVGRGQSWLSPSISRTVIDGYLGRGEGKESGAELTERQITILKHIAEGHNTKEIAARLGLSSKTVETHRAQIMQKTGIREIAGLVRYAIRKGLIRP